MTIQFWCACGAGAVGEEHERPYLVQYMEEHSLFCKESLVDEKVEFVKVDCPDGCGYASYGKTEEEALYYMSNHPSSGCPALQKSHSDAFTHGKVTDI